MDPPWCYIISVHVQYFSELNKPVNTLYLFTKKVMHVIQKFKLFYLNKIKCTNFKAFQAVKPFLVCPIHVTSTKILPPFTPKNLFSWFILTNNPISSYFKTILSNHQNQTYSLNIKSPWAHVMKGLQCQAPNNIKYPLPTASPPHTHQSFCLEIFNCKFLRIGGKIPCVTERSRSW